MCVRVCRCIDVALSTKLMLKCISLITSIAFVFFLNCFSRALGGLSVWWMCQIVRDACALFESSSTSICTQATLGEGEWGKGRGCQCQKNCIYLLIFYCDLGRKFENMNCIFSYTIYIYWTSQSLSLTVYFFATYLIICYSQIVWFFLLIAIVQQ